MKAASTEEITLEGRPVCYQLVRSKTARKLRIRVGLDGIRVVQPEARTSNEIEAFLLSHGEWIIGQLHRIERMQRVRRPHQSNRGQILYRGVPTSVRVEEIAGRRGSNKVVVEEGCLVIRKGENSTTSPSRTLENWLRKQARTEIEQQLDGITRRLQHFPKKVYVMGQRTKWGNCSSRQNLSFNWRLIMAPEFVLRYLVTHEVVHLAVPDHSQKFWLTVQSLCPDMGRAKQWLVVNGQQLHSDFQALTLAEPES
jgi:predicted metal-dependent hydrolase